VRWAATLVLRAALATLAALAVEEVLPAGSVQLALGELAGASGLRETRGWGA
jgi:hypothetical protein